MYCMYVNGLECNLKNKISMVRLNILGADFNVKDFGQIMRLWTNYARKSKECEVYSHSPVACLPLFFSHAAYQCATLV